MKKYIDAEKLKKIIHKSDLAASVKCAMFKLVKDAPEADVKERKHGEWKNEPPGCFSCSVCKMVYPFLTAEKMKPRYNYCIYCGAYLGDDEE